MESSDFIRRQKEILSELLRDKLISEEEYNFKLKAILEKESEENKEQFEKELDTQVKNEISSSILKLENSLKAGLLTQEEFEQKKECLYNNKKEELIKKGFNPSKVEEKDHWKVFLFIGFILFFFLFVAVLSFKNSLKTPSSSESLNQELDKSLDKPKTVKYLFHYNKRQLVLLDGDKMKNQNIELDSGMIEFQKNEILFSSEKGNERFIIDKIQKAPGSDFIGSTLFDTDNNLKEKYKISIIHHENGADLVIIHSIELEVMTIFYINKGFTLDLKIYNTPQ